MEQSFLELIPFAEHCPGKSQHYYRTGIHDEVILDMREPLSLKSSTVMIPAEIVSVDGVRLKYEASRACPIGPFTGQRVFRVPTAAVPDYLNVSVTKTLDTVSTLAALGVPAVEPLITAAFLKEASKETTDRQAFCDIGGAPISFERWAQLAPTMLQRTLLRRRFTFECHELCPDMHLFPWLAVVFEIRWTGAPVFSPEPFYACRRIEAPGIVRPWDFIGDIPAAQLHLRIAELTSLLRAEVLDVSKEALLEALAETAAVVRGAEA